LVFSRLTLAQDGMVATVLNDGPDPVTIAQVQVDDAYWQFAVEPRGPLAHLQKATLRIPYPWVQGEAHVVRLVTATGTTFDHEVPIAVESPRPGARYFATFALIGLYVGVIPVAVGLLWYPLIARLRRSALDFVLALTVGLLLFLMVDATAEGLESAAALPDSYQGVALFGMAGLGAYLALVAFGRWLKERRRDADSEGRRGLVLALLIAVGIGLHNFGEGLAIAGAYALGEMALGGLLIVGFTLHNTTEGLAIVAPLARGGGAGARPSIGTLLQLGLIGGVPTIAGAWLGAFIYSPVWAVLVLGLGVGAIVQVVVQILSQMFGTEITAGIARVPVASGLVAGFLIMYATGMLVG
jgi:zinc transporter ZupT